MHFACLNLQPTAQSLQPSASLWDASDLYLYFQARVCAALRESPIISFYYIHTFRFADTRPYARALIPFFTYCHTFSLTGSDGQDRASGDDQGLSALHGAKTFSEQFYDRSAGIRICKKNARRWMI